VDAGDDCGGAEGQLLVLEEEVVRVLVEHHASDGLHGEDVLGPRLGDVQRVEGELVLVGRVHGLDAELPLGKVAPGDGVIEVLGGVAVVLAADHDGLVVQQALDAALGDPMELDVGLASGLVDEDKGVDAKALHVAVVERDADVVEEEGEHVHGFRDV